MLQTRPTCPRCGYDQSGAVASWETSDPPACPLRGVCSECGLGFEWVDLLSPARGTVPGFFEHAAGSRHSAWWAVRTWLMTLRPRRFWTRIRLEIPVVVRRAALWPVVLTAGVWALGSILWNVVGLPSVIVGGGVQGWAGVLNSWLDPIGQLRVGLGGWSFGWAYRAPGWTEYLAPLAAMSVVWGGLMLVLPSTLRAARVRRAHVLRATAYSLAWAPLAAGVKVLDGVWFSLCQVLAPSTPRGPAGPVPWLWNMRPSDWLQGVAPLALVLMTVWLMVWWRRVLGTGFRLERAGMVWCVLAVPATLAWTAALLLCTDAVLRVLILL